MHYKVRIINLKQQLFVVGNSGSENEGDRSNGKTEILDIKNEKWIEKADFLNNSSIYFYSALSWHNSVYIFGGIIIENDRPFESDKVVAFTEDEYNIIGYLLKSRSRHEVIQVNEIIYIIGGER